LVGIKPAHQDSILMCTFLTTSLIFIVQTFKLKRNMRKKKNEYV